MRPIAALLAAFPLLAAAQTPPPTAPPQTWTTEPPPAAAPAPAQPEATPPAAAQPAQAAPAPTQPAYPPPPQYAPPPQYPPPPQYAPPPQPPPQYAPQPPRPYARPPKTRDHWYIGFGFGGGDGKVKANGTTYDLADLHTALAYPSVSGGQTNIFMNFKVGGTMSPKLLLGGDFSFMGSVTDKDGVSTSYGVGNFDAILTFFPVEKGFFLRGGLGLSSMSLSSDTPYYGKEDLSATGFNLTGGLGYALWIGQHFNLTANLDFSRQWFGTNEGSLADAGVEIKDAQYWALWLGFDWY